DDGNREHVSTHRGVARGEAARAHSPALRVSAGYEDTAGDFTTTAAARGRSGPDRIRAARRIDHARRGCRRHRSWEVGHGQFLVRDCIGARGLMMPVVVLAAGVIASWIDLRSRRVPNLLTMPLACAGLFLAATGASGLTVTDAMFGCA